MLSKAAAEMRALITALCLLGCTTVSAAQSDSAAPRFSGSASLSPPIAQSADQRFAINAKLQANRVQSSGRFSLEARLLPDAKAAGAFCGPDGDLIFRDGFEV
ncbi:MAG TPA: hypothetical protein VFN25_00350 [Dokdonella sp.]|uniref:hypothetical protein n=1 Tax=Dokdonella sp. TaxID=2291710 RepID=UPI002D7FCD94|nr:hypothetical protein [Dokdonella sp.]HET9031332.1 hypothetical protein [Dokdonella sp.]